MARMFGMNVGEFNSFATAQIEEQIPQNGIFVLGGELPRTPHYAPLSQNPFVAMETITDEENDRSTARVLWQVKTHTDLEACIKLMPETSVSEFRGQTPASIISGLDQKDKIPLNLGEIASQHLAPDNLRELNKVFGKGPVLVLGDKHTDNQNMVLFIEGDLVTWVCVEEVIDHCNVFFF